MNPPVDHVKRMADAVAVLRAALHLAERRPAAATTPAAVAALAAAVPAAQALGRPR